MQTSEPFVFQGRFRLTSLLFLLTLALNSPTGGLLAERNRVTGRIDNQKRVFLSGHLHPKAVAENDEGPVPASMTMPRVTLSLKASETQQAELDRLLAAQQDPSSPEYRRWLTPEEY